MSFGSSDEWTDRPTVPRRRGPVTLPTHASRFYRWRTHPNQNLEPDSPVSQQILWLSRHLSVSYVVERALELVDRARKVLLTPVPGRDERWFGDRVEHVKEDCRWIDDEVGECRGGEGCCEQGGEWERGGRGGC